MGVDGDMGQTLDDGQAAYKTSDHGFADPAQSQANHRDAELDAVYDLVEILVKSQNDAGADTSGFNELLDARVAHADEREFRGCEERVGCHEEEDQKDPEQHESEHGWVILTFEGS